MTDSPKLTRTHQEMR